MTVTIKRSGFSLRRPRAGKRSVAADIRAEVVSRHRTARAALTALRTQPRTDEGYSNCFLFDERTQRAVSNYDADTGVTDRGRLK